VKRLGSSQAVQFVSSVAGHSVDPIGDVRVVSLGQSHRVHPRFSAPASLSVPAELEDEYCVFVWTRERERRRALRVRKGADGSPGPVSA